MQKQGLLIAFEGIDGTGKSTQIRMMAEAMRHAGVQVIETREPTDGPYGRKIRELYQSRLGVTQEEELDLFLKDRREHVDQVVNPALTQGKIVLTDRYYFSTAAYQGACGLIPEEIIRMNEAFAPRPDLVLLFVIPVALSLHRIQSLRGESLNAFEQEENLRKVADIFSWMTDTVIQRIDGSRSIELVHLDVKQKVDFLLSERDFPNVVL